MNIEYNDNNEYLFALNGIVIISQLHKMWLIVTFN